MNKTLAGAVGLLVATVMSGCSVAAKQATADRIIAAGQAAMSSGGLAASLSVQVIPLPGPRPAAPGPQRIVAVKAGPLAAVIYPSLDEAQVSPASGQPPALIFTARRMYERRAAAGSTGLQGLLSAAGGGVSNLMALSASASVPSTAATPSALSAASGNDAGISTSRPWVTLDFSRLPAQGQDQTAGSFGVNPALLVRLVTGTLTGSVKVSSTQRTARAEAAGYRFYRVNFDLDKAEKGLADSDKQVIARILKSNAVRSTVVPGEVWLDPQGRLAGVAVSLIQWLDPDTRALQIVVLNFTGRSSGSGVTVPGPDETVSVGSLGALVHGVA